jgi:SAM-dependent methyltransferase
MNTHSARMLTLHEGIKLHLGCGTTHFPDWENVDQAKHSPHVDQAFDLMSDWPYADNSVSAVYASHVLEHLPHPLHFFQELWRVMMPMSSALLRLPHGGHKSAWGDITHLRAYWPETFACLQPGYAASVGNPQLDTWPAPFGIGGIDVRVMADLTPLLKWRLGRRFFLWLTHYLPTLGEELFVDLYPLKTLDAQAQYRATHTANVVPLRYIVYRHQWEGRPMRPGEAADIVPVAEPAVRDRLQGYA